MVSALERPVEPATARARSHNLDGRREDLHAGCMDVPICRDAAVTWREGLLGLADRLGQPVPVNPCASPGCWRS